MTARRHVWITVAAIIATVVLVIVGGVVRVTGSGMGCPDWPLCYGRIVPPAGFAPWIEQVHRYVAAITSLFVLAAAYGAWRRRAVDGGSWPWAVAGLVLLAVQVALGAATVFTGNRPDTVVAHLLLALLLLACLVVIATRSAIVGGIVSPALSAGRPPTTLDGLPGQTALLVALTLALSLFGSAVQVTNGGYSCPDFPLCGGQLWPATRGVPAQLHVVHRLLALGVGVALAAAATASWRSGHDALRKVAAAAVALYALQVVVGVAQVTMYMHVHLRATHLVLATLFWVTVVAMAALARGLARGLVRGVVRGLDTGVITADPPAVGGDAAG